MKVSSPSASSGFKATCGKRSVLNYLFINNSGEKRFETTFCFDIIEIIISILVQNYFQFKNSHKMKV